jgi:hypothetical protein
MKGLESKRLNEWCDKKHISFELSYDNDYI